MTSKDSSAPQGEEIIAPIRVRTAPAGNQTAARPHPRRVGVAAALLLIAALTAGGIWWIGHLSRHPVETSPATPLAETPPTEPTPPLPGAQATSEPPQPSPQLLPAAAAPASPAASRNAEQAEAVRQHLASAERLAAAGNLAAAQSDFR